MSSDYPLWHVLQTTWGEGSTYDVTYLRDTTFCAQTYSIYQHPTKNRIYVRSDSLRAWYRQDINCQNPEKLIYDFSLQVGDQKYFPRNLQDSILFRVLKKDTLIQQNIGKIEALVLEVVPQNAIKRVVWYKGIGSDMGPFYFLDLNFVYDAGTSLYCFSKSDTLKYKAIPNGSCDTIIQRSDIGIKVTKGSYFSLSPNPASSKLNIDIDETSKVEIQLENMLGQRLINQTLTNLKNQIDIAHLSPGLYLLTLTNQNGEKLTEKIKIE
jgi:hypothetical protein